MGQEPSEERREVSSRGEKLATRAALALVLLLAALFVARGIAHRGQAVDDAFISFRFAQNLANGDGLRWNPTGEPCEGYTNFIHVAMVAAAMKLGARPDDAALAIGIAAGLLAAALVLGSIRPRRELLWAAIPTAALLTDENLLIHATRGLETVSFASVAALLVLTLARVDRTPRPGLAGFGIGVLALALVLTRPDGGLIAAMGMGCMLLMRLRVPAARNAVLVAGATFSVLLMAYLGWKLSYFGYVLPNAFYMKANASGWPGLEHALAFAEEYRIELAVAALAVLAGAALRPRDPVPWIAVAVALPWFVYGMRIIHEIGFSHRFIWPMVPLVALATARGLRSIQDRLSPPWPIAALALVATLAALAPRIAHGFTELTTGVAPNTLNAAFSKLGRDIAAFGLGTDLQLMCTHAGATPFYAGAHHVDPVGLVDNGFSRRSPREERARYIATLRPDVTTSPFFPASPEATSLSDDPRVAASRYYRKRILGLPEDLDEGLRQSRLRQNEAYLRQTWRQMEFLRNVATMVGEMRTKERRWRLFVYVIKTSPHHDELVAHLRERVDILAEDVDFDGYPD